MTYQETFQLGIEFERRLIEIDPSFEVENKPDTETIYAFLNEYAKQYFDDIIKQLMVVKDRDVISDLQEKVKDLIKEEYIYEINDSYNTIQPNCKSFNLPTDYYKYIRSYSKCLNTYKFEQKEGSGEYVFVENKIFSEYQDYSKINNTYNDGFIFRNPLVIFEREQDTNGIGIQNPITVLHDNYTTISSILLVYYKKIQSFTILTNGYDCELSSSCFWDIVKGAVDLYIYNYKFGVTLESLKRRARAQLQDQQNNAKQQQQEDDQ